MKSQQLTYKQKTITSQGYKHHSRIVEPIFRVFFFFYQIEYVLEKSNYRVQLVATTKMATDFPQEANVITEDWKRFAAIWYFAVGKSLNKTFEYLSKFNLK